MQIEAKLVMKKYLYLISVIFLLKSHVIYSSEKDANITLNLSDDPGYGDLSNYGNTRTKAPNIYRLTKEGVLFTAYQDIIAQMKLELIRQRELLNDTESDNPFVLRIIQSHRNV